MKKYRLLFKRMARVSIGFSHLTHGLVQILTGLLCCAQILAKNIVITSINDHKHSRNSKHYDNLAVDVRTWNLTKVQIDYILVYMNKIYGIQAIYEAKGTPNAHIHLEYDPEQKHGE